LSKKPKNAGFLNRLQELVAEFGQGRYTRLADLVGVSSVTMMGYIQGKNLPGFEIIERLVNACGVSPNWILKGWPPKYAAEKPPVPDQIRIVDVAAAGNIESKDFVSVPILELSAWRDVDRGIVLVGPDTTSGYTVARSLPNSRLVAVRQIEDSMSPEIEAGDLCVVDLERKKPQDLESRLVLADAGGLVSVRRLAQGMLLSNNQRSFPPVRATKKILLGCVTQIRRDHAALPE